MVWFVLKDKEIRAAWIVYLSEFPHVSAYFRAALAYTNQISLVNGRKTGSDVNLYKLFVERCFRLARSGGRSGVITPAGIYTDLGTKQLRELLFSQANWNSLFGFSNEKFLFEGVHHAQKFCIAVFQKGQPTKSIEVAFRINPREAVSANGLDEFLNSTAQHLQVPVDLIRRLSPDSLSVMEFKNNGDIGIAEKMLQFPLLGEKLTDVWNFSLTAEFHMTSDSKLFRNSPSQRRLPLFEGKMTWQFSHTYAEPRFWIDEAEGRKALLGRAPDAKQLLDYQGYRCGIRAVASNTNERSLISSVLPANVFCGNSVLVTAGRSLDAKTLLFLTAVLDSFVMDALLRMKVSQNINMFYVYQLPIPRLTEKDAAFAPIVSRAAKLICTTPEFDELAREVGLSSHAQGVTDPADRAQLRAELDSLIAHLYGLTENEFAYILTTFPLVAQPVKDAALQAFRAFAPKPGDPEITRLLMARESGTIELKSSARWDLRENKKSPLIEQIILKTAAAFLNSDGGTLLLGIADDGTVLGLKADYQTLKKQNADGYELFLADLLLTHYGKDLSRYLKFSFHEVEGKEICRVAIEPSPRPVWVKEGNEEHLYIRAGNSTRRLSTKEAIEYCKTRF